MNILILVNNAENYPPVFVALGSYLQKNGHRVCFAFDSHLPDFTYADYCRPIEQKKFYFSDYLQGSDEPLRGKYAEENLWRMYYSDFERYSIYGLHKDKPKEYFARVAVKMLHFYDDLFSKEKIDLVIFENVSNIFSHAAYTVAQHYHKRYLAISGSRLPGRFEIIDSLYDAATPINTTFHQLLALQKNGTEISPYIKNYLEKFLTIEPDYMVNNVLAPTRSLHSQYFTTQKIHSIFAMISYLLFAAKDVYYSHQIGNPLTYSWKMLRRNLLRKIRLRRLNRFFETYSYQDKYYLYPLHFHPESSTSVQAPDYIDELSTIRNIAFSLPFGSYLYVKDHKSAAGYQSPAFYQGIKNLPNVKLLHYNCDTKKLITHAQGIITLTSTVGYEALLLGKPVYLLGRVFYEGHPNCTSIAAPRDLFPLLNKAPPQAPVDPYLTAAFAEAYYQHTFEGSLDTSKRSHPREFYQTIAKYIDHLPNIMPAAHIGNPHENPSGWATTTSDNRLRHSQ